MSNPMTALYPDNHPRSVGLLARYQCDVLLEAVYQGLDDPQGERDGMVRFEEMHKFKLVQVLAGREQKTAVVFVPQDDDRLKHGRTYWLAAKKGEGFRVV